MDYISPKLYAKVNFNLKVNQQVKKILLNFTISKKKIPFLEKKSSCNYFHEITVYKPLIKIGCNYIVKYDNRKESKFIDG